MLSPVERRGHGLFKRHSGPLATLGARATFWYRRLAMKALLWGSVLAGAIVVAGAITPASALPVGINPLVANQTTAGATPVRWVCDAWGRCFHQRGPRWAGPPSYPRYGWGSPPRHRGWGPPPGHRGWGPPGHYGRGW